MKVWVDDMKVWFVALVMLLGISNAAWSQVAKDAEVAQEERTHAQKTVLTRPLSTPVPVVVLGIVAALDPKQGALVLWHGDGTHSDLTAPPKLLEKVRIGDPVSAVVDGSIVRNVERLDPPSPRA
jgi:hypothetical protein